MISRRVRRGGINYVSYGLVAREVERVDSGYRSMMSVQGSPSWCHQRVFGTRAQKQKFLPRLQPVEWIGCFGLTETGAGFRSRRMTSVARRGGRLLAHRHQVVDHQQSDR